MKGQITCSKNIKCASCKLMCGFDFADAIFLQYTYSQVVSTLLAITVPHSAGPEHTRNRRGCRETPSVCFQNAFLTKPFPLLKIWRLSFPPRIEFHNCTVITISTIIITIIIIYIIVFPMSVVLNWLRIFQNIIVPSFRVQTNEETN
jgi:hypothetical protein